MTNPEYLAVYSGDLRGLGVPPDRESIKYHWWLLRVHSCGLIEGTDIVGLCDSLEVAKAWERTAVKLPCFRGQYGDGCRVKIVPIKHPQKPHEAGAHMMRVMYPKLKLTLKPIRVNCFYVESLLNHVYELITYCATHEHFYWRFPSCEEMERGLTGKVPPNTLTIPCGASDASHDISMSGSVNH